MEWCAPYIGIPFVEHGRDRGGCDCWGLVRLVYAERLGVELPAYSGDYKDTRDGESISGLCRSERRRWQTVGIERPMDVICLRVRGLPWHVGLVAEPGRMLHVIRGAAACIEDYTRPLWARRVEGIYRWLSEN